MSKSDAAEAKERFITPPFRMNFPKFDAPKAYKAGDKPVYSSEMLFKPEQMTQFFMGDGSGGIQKNIDIAKVLRKLAYIKWPGIKDDQDAFKDHWKKVKGGSNWPIKKGEAVIKELTKKAEAKGKKVPDLSYLEGLVQMKCKASEAYPPKLMYREAGKKVELDRSNPEDMKKIKKFFTGGNYAYAECTASPSETDTGNYITIYVNEIVYVKEGARLGGGGGLMSAFDGIDGGETDFEPEDEDFGDDDI